MYILWLNKYMNNCLKNWSVNNSSNSGFLFSFKEIIIEILLCTCFKSWSPMHDGALPKLRAGGAYCILEKSLFPSAVSFLALWSLQK